MMCSTPWLDVTAIFKGENIRSVDQLSRKMELFFNSVTPVDMMTVRNGPHTTFKIVVNKLNFLNLICHDNYGTFEDDYELFISNFYLNSDGSSSCYRLPDSPLKMVERFNNIDGSNRELTVTIRRGKDPTDQPARGMQTYHLMSDPKEVIKVLEHFDLLGKIVRCTKATPQRPTLQIKLSETVLDTFDLDNYMEPCLIYHPAPQSIDAGATELWAHLYRSGDNQRKRVTIEGVEGITDMKEIKHRLSYHGELLTDLQPRYWDSNDGDLAGLSNIPNGDVTVFMNLKVELNFILIGKDAFRVTYQNQSPQCSYCYSWLHRAGQCDRKHMGRAALHQSYLDKWVRLVGYQDKIGDDRNVLEAPETEAEAPTPSSPSTSSPPAVALFRTPKTSGATAADAAADDGWSKVTSRKQKKRSSKSSSAQDTDNSTDSDDLDSTASKSAQEKPPKPNLTPGKVTSQMDNIKTLTNPPKIPPKPSPSPTKPEAQTNKRKADSPLANEAKTTGSGDRITHHAERYKSVFFNDKNFLKLRDLSLRKELSTVEREKSKMEIAELEIKYKRFILENPNGRDPDEEKCWDIIKSELDKIRMAMKFRQP